MKGIVPLFCIPLMAFCACTSPAAELAFPENYRQWKKPVKRILDYPVPGHGDTARIIYANDIAFRPVVTGEKNRTTRVEMKNGAIIVKEVYANSEAARKKSKTPSYIILDIMYKNRSHPENQDGWLYYIMEPGGELTRIKGRLCVECHVAANESHPYFDGNRNETFRDYLFVPFGNMNEKTRPAKPARKKGGTAGKRDRS